MMRFVRGDMLIAFLVKEEIVPLGTTSVTINANDINEPLFITATFMTTEEDAKKIMGYDFVQERL